MINNLILSILIAAALCYVGLNLNRPTQRHPVVASAVMASSALGGDPVIVWYGTVNHSGWENPEPVILRAGSDGTIEAMKVQGNYQCDDPSVCGGGWTVLSSPQMACRTDIDGNGAVELGDLLAVLSQWGQEASCPDVVQLQCGLMQLNLWFRVALDR